MIEARYATSADIDRYYGGRPQHTMQAVMAFMDGVPAGMIGLAKAGRYWVLVSEFRPELRPHLRCITILRAIKLAQEMVARSGARVIAMVDGDEPQSRRIIERLGFVQSNEDSEVYVWPS